MCVCGWSLVVATIACQAIVLGYGELERRRANASHIKPRHAQTDEPPQQPRPSVTELRQRHRADELPYYPGRER